MEMTYGFVKPDAYASRREIEKMIEKSGLEMVFRKDPYFMSRQNAIRHYEHLAGKPFFEENLHFVLSGPTDQLILAGENAVERLMHLAGHTDPKKADAGTIRQLYGSALPKNAFHRSDSAKSAAREIMLHLRDEKLPEEVMVWLAELGYLNRCR